VPFELSRIRNFCIIAHIDHGKSTLADRILEITGAVEKREMRDQLLDAMDLERERGITIKAKSVSMDHRIGGQTWRLNLIDTPGHVDFAYEVSRSLAACEGALLLVDAAQGVEAQTVANAFLAIEANLEIIPVLNKVDLGNARPDEVIQEMHTVLGIDPDDVLRVSGKSGLGVTELLQAVVERVPAPDGDAARPLQALIFDSVFNDYRGVVVHVRVRNGTLKKGDRIVMMGERTQHQVDEVGRFLPEMEACDALGPGEVGYVIANIKSIRDVTIGDTITQFGSEDQVQALPGYRQPKPMVFCGLYPSQNSDYEALRQALDKLRLNDSSFTFVPDTSDALGFGFRCGFLGLLHMEIVKERLERESGLSLVQTAPNVSHEVLTADGKVTVVESPRDLPDPSTIQELREPIVRISMVIPAENIGALMKICTERRGRFVKTEYLSTTRVILVYDLPLSEVIFDFYDKLKSATRGYGTMDYDVQGFFPAELVRLRILVGGGEVDALSAIVHREKAESFGRALLRKLRKEIPRHLFEVSLQAAIGGKIIARESIAPLRKNVTSKCYGGDITRKRKLLEKQKEGKRRMKLVGQVEIPEKAFLAVLDSSLKEEGP
jgi:GTP-binding protein LepA